jgi:glyoxylate/hydroxypyruvate reductase A
MAILCGTHQVYGAALTDRLRQALPDEDIRVAADPGNPEDIDICMVFRMKPGYLKPFANLRLISATGAGVDHYLLDPHLPRDIPLVRIVDANFAAMMADYVMSWVLFHHRQLGDIIESQKRHEWVFRPLRPAADVTVGVMGLGQMGTVTAQRLAAQGYAVRGWARSRHTIAGVTAFAGSDEFAEFLGKSEILVNLLPLTDATRGILRQSTFDAMPRGSVVISAGRGGHLNEADLCAALASGRLRAATVDAFAQEPLPPEHPLWEQRNLYITPHCSSTASLDTIVEGFAANVRRFRRGEPLLNRVDHARGY